MDLLLKPRLVLILAGACLGPVVGRSVLAQPAKDAPRRIHCRFDKAGECDEFDNDPGMAVTVQDGEVRVTGRTTDKEWKGDGVALTFDDPGGGVDISGKFRLAKRGASGLVCLCVETERAGALVLLFEWHPHRTVYGIQCRWLKLENELENGRGFLPPNWNEETKFNALRISICPSRAAVAFCVNDSLIDRVVFGEPVGRLLSLRLQFQTPAQGREFDIRFDDVIVAFH